MCLESKTNEDDVVHCCLNCLRANNGKPNEKSGLCFFCKLNPDPKIRDNFFPKSGKPRNGEKL